MEDDFEDDDVEEDEDEDDNAEAEVDDDKVVLRREDDNVEDDNVEEDDEKDDNVAEDDVAGDEVEDDDAEDDVKGEEDDDVEEEENDDVEDDDVEEVRGRNARAILFENWQGKCRRPDGSHDRNPQFARGCAVECHESPFMQNFTGKKCRRPRLRPTLARKMPHPRTRHPFCASLRSRNAHGHVTRAISYRYLLYR